MDFQELALRWLHILSAIALVGGTFFWRLALAPALAGLDESQRKSIDDVIRPRWARVVMVTSAVLLLSGFWNAIENMREYAFENRLYSMLVGVKLLLGLVIMFIAAKLSGRSESAERFRERQLTWLTVNALLATVLVCTAGVMKVTPHIVKSSAAASDVGQDARDVGHEAMNGQEAMNGEQDTDDREASGLERATAS